MLSAQRFGRGRFQAGAGRSHWQTSTCPLFAVSTIKDHVAPWKFGIQNSFAHRYGPHFCSYHRWPQCRHRQRTRPSESQLPNRPIMPRRAAPRSRDVAGRLLRRQEGSWWPAWQNWLVATFNRSASRRHRIGRQTKDTLPLDDAPALTFFKNRDETRH